MAKQIVAAKNATMKMVKMQPSLGVFTPQIGLRVGMDCRAGVVTDTYLRPDGTSTYFRPGGGTFVYNRP